ncbi:MAG: hypothetical protein AB7G21_14735 [Dehalococcoidia bacterium]
MRTRTPGAHREGPSAVITVAVILALLAPIVAPIAGGELWGWLPEHGHASVSGPVGAHTHPWDAPAPAGDAAEDDAPVFTAGDLLGAPAVPVSLVVLLAIPMLVGGAVPQAVRLSVRAPYPVLEPPPPR